MSIDEFSDIVDLAVDYKPERFLGVVFGDFVSCEGVVRHYDVLKECEWMIVFSFGAR